MPPSSKVSYEFAMFASPVLLWALERKLGAQKAAAMGCGFHARENSAWLILDGRAQVRHDGETHEAGPGQWIFPKPGPRHQSFDGPLHFLSLTIRWKWPDGRHLFDRGLTRVVDAARIPAAGESARRIIRRIESLAPGSHYYLGVNKLDLSSTLDLFDSATEWARAFLAIMLDIGVEPDLGGHLDPRVEQIHRILEDLPAHLPIAREKIAATIGLSPRQMERLLKQATGQTLAETRDALRFAQCTRLILEKGRRVKEVASESGFSDLSTFSRWFARKAGCSPRVYRDRFG